MSGAIMDAIGYWLGGGEGRGWFWFGGPFKLHTWGSVRNEWKSNPARRHGDQEEVLFSIAPIFSRLSKCGSICHHGCVWFLI